jgi:hypothetical protein
MKRIMHVLLMHTACDNGIKSCNIHRRHGHLRTLIIIGQHFAHHYILETIVVNISDVCPHRIHGDMIGRLFYLFPEGSVFLVDIHVVAFSKIISNKNVSIAVVVNVGSDKAKRISKITGDTCL